MQFFSRVSLAARQWWKSFWRISGRNCTCPRMIEIASLFFVVSFVFLVISLFAWVICSRCSSRLFEKMITSYIYTMQKFHLHIRRMMPIVCCNISGTLCRSKGIHINWNSPWWVKNPVLCRYVHVFRFVSIRWCIPDNSAAFVCGPEWVHKLSILGLGYESRMVIALRRR